MTKIIIKSVLIIFFLLATNAQSSENGRLQIQRFDGSSIDFYIRKNSSTIHSRTILLLIQGSDCNSVLYIDAIADLKFAWPGADLLLIEKYGITPALTYSKDVERKDCPTAYLKMDSLDQRVSDVLQVVKKVEAMNIYERFLMIGGSEGAVVANTVASRTNSIDATASFNGGGRWFLDDVIHSIKYGKKDTPELRAEIEGFTEMASQIVSNAAMEIKISGHGSRWWRSVLQLDQFRQLSKVESPLLIIQSDMDRSVSVKSTDEMIELLLKNRKQNIEYKKYAGLDHYFRTASGESKLADVADDINKWFAAKVETASNNVFNLTP